MYKLIFIYKKIINFLFIFFSYFQMSVYKHVNINNLDNNEK